MIAAGTLPFAAEQWSEVGGTIESWWTSVSKQSVVIGQDFSWMTIAAIAVGILLIVLLLVMIFAQGGGKVGNIPDPNEDELGRTRVTTNFISDLIRPVAEENEWIHSISTSSYAISKEPVLCLDVITYKGAPLAQIAEDSRKVVADIDSVLGNENPIYVHIKTNWQSAMTQRKRVS